MGNIHSNKSKAIDKQIKRDQKRLNREVKILLLGKDIGTCDYHMKT